MNFDSNRESVSSRPFAPQWFFLPPQALKDVEKGFYSRWGHSIDIIDGELYIFGGTVLKRSQTKIWDSMYKIDLKTWHCEELINRFRGPGQRTLHSMFYYERRFYVFGGNTVTKPRTYQGRDLVEFNIQTYVWSSYSAPGAPSTREGQCCCMVKGRYAVIFGGWNGTESFDDYFVFDLKRLQWLEIKIVKGKKPSPRENQSCCAYEDVIYVFGGQGKENTETDKTSDIYLDELYKLEVIIEEDEKVILDWQEIVNEVRPPKRASHAACIFDGKMFVIGGEGYQQGSEERNQQTIQKSEDQEEFVCYPKNDVWYFDIKKNEWQELQVPNASQFTSRLGHRVISYESYILVIGGLRDYNRPASEVSVLSMYGDDPFSVVKAQAAKNSENLIDVEELEMFAASDRNTTLDKARETGRNSQQPPEPLVHRNRPVSNKLKAAIERTATKLENTVVSMGFVASIAGLIGSPLAAFGLLVDNAMINKATNLQITSSKFSPMNTMINESANKSQSKSKKKKDVINEEEKADESSNQTNSNLWTPYLVIEDNGKGWKLNEFLRILLNYDLDTPQSFDLPDMSEAEAFEEDERVQRINEYALNLKAGCFRLGRTLVFVTKYEDEISMGMLTTEKQYGAGAQSGQVFYASWKKSTGAFLTENGSKYWKIILKAMAGFTTEEEIMRSFEKYSTRIFVLDLNLITVGEWENKPTQDTELVQKRKGQEPATDIRVRALGKELKRLYSRVPPTLVDLSLRAYLSHLFLDGNKVGLEIKLNEAVIVNAGLKELVNMKGEENSVTVKQEGLFNAVIVGTRKRGMKEKKGTKDATVHDKDQSQGILMYYNNRLIRRFENSALGNLDFSVLRYQPEGLDVDCGYAGSKETYGYVELESPFKPNFVKTEIENFYYSNFLYAELLTKVMEVDNVLGKRSADYEEGSEYDTVTKKLKQA